MFVRLLLLFVLIVLAAGAASWLMAQPGNLSIEWLGWQMEMRSSLAVTLVVITALLLVFFDRLQRALWSMPRWLGGRWRERRHTAGHRALTLGLMAVSAGEPMEARKQAARARRLLNAPQLTGLLSAQAAHLAGDNAAARRYFTALTHDRDTEFLGQIGLMRLALDAKDSEDALAAGGKALDLRPQSALAAAQLLQLHSDQQNWGAALEVLAIVIKDRKKQTGMVPQLLTRQCTALLYLDGLSALESEEDTDRASGRFTAALGHDPAFLPAIFASSDLHISSAGKRKATKLLENSFTLVPHAGIVDRLLSLWDENDGKSIARLVKLIPKKQGPIQQAAYHIISDIAASKGLGGEATRLRALYDINMVTFGWQCDVCKGRHDSWSSHCPSCGQFAGLVWQQSENVTPLFGE
jgi:HemY protein